MSKFSWRNGFASGLIVGTFLAILLTIFVLYGHQDTTQLAHAAHHGSDVLNQCGNKNQPVWGPWFGMCFGLYDSIAQWLMMALTITATIVLILTLKSANETNKAAINTANAALEANDIMRQEQRPWVTLEKDSHCHFCDTGGYQGSIAWNYDFRNKGKTPAYAISGQSKIIKENSMSAIWSQMESFTDECVKKSGLGNVPVIFPGESTNNIKFKQGFSAAYDLSEDAEGILRKNVKAGKKIGFLFCITYRLGLAENSPKGVETRAFLLAERKEVIGPWQHTLLEFSSQRIVR
jgi:hypothetical protein